MSANGYLLCTAIAFFIFAIGVYLMGAFGVGGVTEGMGRTVLAVFVVMAIIFAIVGLANKAIADSTPAPAHADPPPRCQCCCVTP